MTYQLKNIQDPFNITETNQEDLVKYLRVHGLTQHDNEWHDNLKEGVINFNSEYYNYRLGNYILILGRTLIIINQVDFFNHIDLVQDNEIDNLIIRQLEKILDKVSSNECPFKNKIHIEGEPIPPYTLT